MAGAMVRAGYEVTMLGGPGLIVGRARELGVEVVSVPERTRWCVLRAVRLLARVSRERDIDMIHAFEWESIAKAFVATQLFRAHAAVTGTVLSRNPAPVLPRTVPLLMTSRSAVADMRSAGYTRVGLLEPWVNTAENDPAKYGNIGELKTHWGFERHGLLIIVVTAPDSESSTAALATVFDAVSDLAALDLPVQLLVVGDGPRHALAEERATELNHRYARTVSVAAGDVLDRGEAYAAADVVIGSDSSVLHGMAFGKPVVVEGDQGYFRAVNHATAEQFQWSGWYGVGSGVGMGKGELLDALKPLLDSQRLREYRGAYSHKLAQKYELDNAVLRQLQEYRDALDTRVGKLSTFSDLIRVAAVLLRRRGMWRLRVWLHGRRSQNT